MLRKTIGIILALLFLSFAAMQYNDPDPMIWIAIYAVTTVVVVLGAFGRIPVIIFAMACTASVIGAFMMWPATYEGLEVGGGDIKNIEEARESLGLLLIAVVMFFYAIMPGRKKRTAPALKPNIQTGHQ